MIISLKHLRSTSSEEGFTLIELMIVVVIIGILAAIAIPVFANQQKSAGDAALKSDLKNTATAVQTYLTKYPGQTTIRTTQGIDGTIQGWHVVLRGDGAGSFSGQLNTVVPTGFPHVSVSNGTSLGVVSNSYYQNSGGYCILGNNSGSNYSLTAGASLFYDSVLGGIKTTNELTADGACAAYRNTALD